MPTAVRFSIEPPCVPGTICATIVVPAEVPSVRHSSAPAPVTVATNSTVPFARRTNCDGIELMAPVARLATSRVPAAVPSVTNSS